MVRGSYFNKEEQEATDEELESIALTVISVLVMFATVIILTIYFFA